jgi:hypothetical protein
MPRGDAVLMRSTMKSRNEVWIGDFVKSLKKVRWFKPDKTPNESWKLFPSRPAAADAAEKAAKNEPAAIDAARFAAFKALNTAIQRAGETNQAPDWKAAWEAAGARRGEMAWEAFRNALGERLRTHPCIVAGDAAWEATKTAAVAKAGNVPTAWRAALDPIGDIFLYVSIHTCGGVYLAEKHIIHAETRMEVWRKGYGLSCDVHGVLFVYRKII